MPSESPLPLPPSPEDAEMEDAEEAVLKGAATTGEYLERAPGENMMPKSILTEMYGARGERMRHTVHDGALRLPASSLRLMNDIHKQCVDWSKTETPQEYPLPGLDAVVRPTMDKSLGCVQIVELSLVPNAPRQQLPTPVVQPTDPSVPVPEIPQWRTVARTRTLKLDHPASEEAERIRGGGDSEEQAEPNNETSKESVVPPQEAPSADSTAPAAAAAPVLVFPAASGASLVNFQGTGQPPSSSISQQPATSVPGSAPLSLTPSAGVTSTAPALLPAPETRFPPAVQQNFPSAKTEPSTMPEPVPAALQTALAPTIPVSSEVPPAPAPVAAGIAALTARLPAPATATTSAASMNEPPAPASTPSSTQPPSTVTAQVPVTQPPVPGAAPTSTPAAANASSTAAATASSTPVATSSTPAAASTASSTNTDSTAPTSVTSNASVKPPAPPAVVPLKSRPPSQWEQQVPAPNDEMPREPKTAYPSWYNADKVSDLERTLLPEWFDGSAPHRTPASYREARERVIHISDRLGNRYVTSTLVRRTIAGDAGSLSRLHSFLVAYGFINEDAINDSAPTGPLLRDDGKKRVVWNDNYREELVEAVVEESSASSSSKRRKLAEEEEDDDSGDTMLDWHAIAARVGNGASAGECEREFLTMPLQDKVTPPQVERSITPEVASGEKIEDVSMQTRLSMREEILRDIVETSRPEVIQAATDAALRVSENVAEAQKAALLALVCSQAKEQALKEEEAIRRLMAELQEQRMQKLENRLAVLDDVEGILEAERVALELERRDLYTARCRHWFGGGN